MFRFFPVKKYVFFFLFSVIQFVQVAPDGKSRLSYLFIVSECSRLLYVV